ncbi:MAG: hypothetical protein AB1486_08765 [Planctomycetota bacterium]
MKPLLSISPRLPALLCPLLLLLATSALVSSSQQAATKAQTTPAAARGAIGTVYEAWGRARVELDKETLNSILAPEFYVLLDGRQISREKFLGDICQKRVGARLTRFDPNILTVQPTDKGWTVVINEKLEIEILGSGGNRQKAYSFWVTHDGWCQEGDKWLVTFSEAIGHEEWNPGTTPPMEDW